MTFVIAGVSVFDIISQANEDITPYVAAELLFWLEAA